VTNLEHIICVNFSSNHYTTIESPFNATQFNVFSHPAFSFTAPKRNIHCNGKFQLLLMLYLSFATLSSSPKTINIIFKHPVALLHFTHDNYFHHNATIYSFTLPHHNMFRPQSAIIRCSYFAKTVILYWISVIHFTCIILDVIINQIMI
jgi:hypothetical protein